MSREPLDDPWSLELLGRDRPLFQERRSVDPRLEERRFTVRLPESGFVHVHAPEDPCNVRERRNDDRVGLERDDVGFGPYDPGRHRALAAVPADIDEEPAAA